MKAKKDNNKTGYLSVSVVIAHGFPFCHPQDLALFDPLYSPLLFEGEKIFCSSPQSDCKSNAITSIGLTIFSLWLCFFSFLTFIKLKDNRSWKKNVILVARKVNMIYCISKDLLLATLDQKTNPLLSYESNII